MKAILLLFFVSLLLCGCTGKPTGTIEECELKSEISKRDNCYFEHAVTENNLSFCTQIIDDSNRNACINLVS